jgi:biopolymer transport protein ExbD
MRTSLPFDPPPMAEMNVTPLIDVLLVLLIMFVITIPLQTHAVKLDLPAACVGCPDVKPTVNEVAVTATDQISWNGNAVTLDQLRSLVAASQRLSTLPELHLRPAADARYETVDRVLGVIKRERVSRFGFVGNEGYGAF